MPSQFFHPRFWSTWFGILLLRLVVFLPWRWQMAIGKMLGKLLYLALSSRRKVSCINLKIAFPELSTIELESLNQKHFITLGRGLIEAALGWWGSGKQIKQLTHIEGLEYLEETIKNHNVILVGTHFSSLEIGGRIIAQNMPLHCTYRPHQNALIEYLVAKQRALQYGKAIPKSNIREMIRSIKNHNPTWYATDQNFRGKGSILVPFFGIETPTNPGTSRLAKMTGAKVIPCIFVRLYDENDDRKGYLVRFLPPLDNFPSKDLLKDTRRLNQIIEVFAQEFPDQYLWTHKRYKYYDSENKDFYKEYLTNNGSPCE
ncbi:MAG: lipid A biosynthesis lauroyl acyltransferase [Cocleimonas sp.]